MRFNVKADTALIKYVIKNELGDISPITGNLRMKHEDYLKIPEEIKKDISWYLWIYLTDTEQYLMFNGSIFVIMG